MAAPPSQTFKRRCQRRIAKAEDDGPLYSIEKIVLWSPENNAFDGYRVRRPNTDAWGYAVLLGFAFKPDTVFRRPASSAIPQDFRCIQITRVSESLDNAEGVAIQGGPLRLPLKAGAHTTPARSSVPREFRAMLAVSCSCPDFEKRGGKAAQPTAPPQRPFDHANMYGCKHMMMVNKLRLDAEPLPPALPDIFNP